MFRLLIVEMSIELKLLGERCREAVILKGSGDGNMKAAKDLLLSVLRLTELLRQSLQRGSTDAIGDLVETELANMDRAIEEAQNKMEVKIIVVIFLWIYEKFHRHFKV